MILVDTNVIIDILEQDLSWSGWSIAALTDAKMSGPVFTNHVVLAELAGQFFRGGDPREALAALGIELAGVDVPVALRAGAAFAEYRRRGGRRESLITDFLYTGDLTVRPGELGGQRIAGT